MRSEQSGIRNFLLSRSVLYNLFVLNACSREHMRILRHFWLQNKNPWARETFSRFSVFGESDFLWCVAAAQPKSKQTRSRTLALFVYKCRGVDAFRAAFDTAALGGVFNFKSPPSYKLEKETAAQTAAACKGEKVKTMAIYWLLRPIYDREFSCLIQMLMF
jgi:hypothetical protein